MPRRANMFNSMFLETGATKKQRLSYKEANRANRQAVYLKRKQRLGRPGYEVKEKDLTLVISKVPSEIWSKILVYSGNLDLVYTCKRIHNLIVPSYHLEKGLLLEDIAQNHGRLSQVAALWPFTTKEMLEALEVTQFDFDLIPNEFIRTDKFGLVTYLLQHGCKPEDGPLFYEKLLAHNITEAIALLVEQGTYASMQNLEDAIQARSEFAPQLVEQATLETKEMDVLWTAATRVNDVATLSKLEEKI